MRYDTDENRAKIARIGDPTIVKTPQEPPAMEWTADELHRLKQPAFTRFNLASPCRDSRWCDALALHAKVARFGHPLLPAPPAVDTFPKERMQPRTGRGSRGMYIKQK